MDLPKSVQIAVLAQVSFPENNGLQYRLFWNNERKKYSLRFQVDSEQSFLFTDTLKEASGTMLKMLSADKPGNLSFDFVNDLEPKKSMKETLEYLKALSK